MRILSQDGMIDMPYEQMIVNIDYTNKNKIVSCGVSCDGENSIFHIASYSTEAKARKAMEMLREAYSPVLVVKEHQEGLKPNIKPNDWLLTPALPTQRIEVDDNFYFQFPQDSEMEE